MTFWAKSGSSRLNFRWKHHFSTTQSRLNDRIDRYIIPESFNKLSSAVSEIIRGQNSFLKKEIRRYLPIGSDILKMQKTELSSYYVLPPYQKLSKSIQPISRNRGHKN
jgi:hypothetical protein